MMKLRVKFFCSFYSFSYFLSFFRACKNRDHVWKLLFRFHLAEGFVFNLLEYKKKVQIEFGKMRLVLTLSVAFIYFNTTYMSLSQLLGAQVIFVIVGVISDSNTILNNPLIFYKNYARFQFIPLPLTFFFFSFAFPIVMFISFTFLYFIRDKHYKEYNVCTSAIFMCVCPCTQFFEAFSIRI